MRKGYVIWLGSDGGSWDHHKVYRIEEYRHDDGYIDSRISCKRGGIVYGGYQYLWGESSGNWYLIPNNLDQFYWELI